MTIIKTEGTNGIYIIESQSHRTENWMGEGWAVVPPELEAKLMGLYPFLLLTTENGIVTSVEDDVEARKNAPKPERPADPMDEIKLAVAELAVTAAQKDAENKLAIAELAEAMIGGAK